MPLISVIIPTFNRMRYLKQAIESVLAQTLKDYEIIIVDDGSTDGTRELVSSTFAGKVKYIYQANAGQSAARNMGIGQSSGEYIAFLDSDDLWDNTKLQRHIEYHRDNRDVGMSFTNYRYIDSSGTSVDHGLPKAKYVFSGNYLKDLLEMKVPFATPCLMVKKDVFKVAGNFNVDMKLSEDVDMCVRIALASSVGYIDETLASVRLHGDNYVGVIPKEDICLSTIRVFELYKREIQTRGLVVRPYLAHYYVVAGDASKLNGNMRMARAYYLKAICCNPFFARSYKRLIQCLAAC